MKVEEIIILVLAFALMVGLFFLGLEQGENKGLRAEDSAVIKALGERSEQLEAANLELKKFLFQIVKADSVWLEEAKKLGFVK